MNNERATISSWIAKVNEEGYGLTDWELHFMESVTDHFERGGNLSEKQEEILETIYANKTR